MNIYTISGYTRITKAAAVKAYEGGKMIYLSACKMSPASIWRPAFAISKAVDGSLSNLINSFVYYNCTPETGKYISYYVKEGTK